MNYAGRMNSFIFKGGNVLDAIAEYKKMHGLTHLEFNYPEHVEGYDIQELKKAMGDLKVNGLALRWRGSDFLDGDFTHPCEETRRRVIDMCKEATDKCKELGGSVITLWLENDGFEYPFQMDYEKGCLLYTSNKKRRTEKTDRYRCRKNSGRPGDQEL